MQVTIVHEQGVAVQRSNSMESVHNWELEATPSGNSIDLVSREEAVVQVHTEETQQHSESQDNVSAGISEVSHQCCCFSESLCKM